MYVCMYVLVLIEHPILLTLCMIAIFDVDRTRTDLGVLVQVYHVTAYTVEGTLNSQLLFWKTFFVNLRKK